MIDHEQFTFSCRSFNSDNFKEYSSSSARYLFLRYHIVLTHKGRSDGVPDIIGLHVTVHAAQLMYLDLLFPDSTIALDTHLGPIMDSLLSLFRPTPPPPSDSARSTNPVQRPQHLCGPRTVYDSVKDVSKRVDFYEEIIIFAWPSRGGVIVLERPCPADLTFSASTVSIRRRSVTSLDKRKTTLLSAYYCLEGSGGTLPLDTPSSLNPTICKMRR
jgi:hypothetical protein